MGCFPRAFMSVDSNARVTTEIPKRGRISAPRSQRDAEMAPRGLAEANSEDGADNRDREGHDGEHHGPDRFGYLKRHVTAQLSE